MEREKAVKFLRAESWPLRAVCLVLSVPQGTLGSWNQGFNENMLPYVTIDERGKSGKVTMEVVRYVVDAAREHKKKDRRLRIKSFTRLVCDRFKLELSRKTVEEILIANDLFKADTRRRRPRFYQSLCQRIPNGLLSIDGSEFVVWMDDHCYVYNVELAVDTGSFCHTGYSVSGSETAEEVIKVLEQHRLKWGSPLGVISDSGSANLSGKVGVYFKAHGIEPVPVGPGNPKGNGTDEGAFSQMKKAFGVIRVDASSLQALGRSVLENLVGLYVGMRNQMGLRRGEVTPESRMESINSEPERKMERERLCAHKRRRNAPDQNQGKIDRLHFIIEHHNLAAEEPARRRAEHCVKFYDPEAISRSEEAFLRAVSRDPRRAGLPYFFGILKNIQKEIDDDRYRSYCNERYNYGSMLENERRIREQRELQNDLPTVKGIVGMAEKAVTERIKFLRDFSYRKAKEWTEKLLKSVQYAGPIKKQIADAVSSLRNLELDQQERIMSLLDEFINPKTAGKSVTSLS